MFDKTNPLSIIKTMKKVLQILQGHKHFIIWTICYIFVLWAILHYIFGFCIFNLAHWHRVAHSQLRGFVGFVFGAVILAAPLIYISTSALIIRNKKPLITIPLPKLPKIWNTKQPEAPAPETTETTETTEKTQDDTPELDTHIPPEIRAAFIRAKNHPLDITINQPESDTAEDTVNTDNTELPLPPDFDITFDSDQNSDNVPTFTDFNFDDTPDSTSDITEYLHNKNIEFEIIDDIIVTKTHAIATHEDSDFWVTDNENWFASGKTKPSPILSVKTIAEQHNIKPILYLAETNIMDIETLIPQWESDGITVITDISDL